MRWMSLMVVGMLALAACRDDRYIFVETQPGLLALADPARWVAEPGRVELAVPGTFRYAQVIAFRFGIESVSNHDVTQIETVTGVLTPRPTRTGTPCAVSVLPVCQGVRCEAEIAVLGVGHCVIRIGASSTDGERRGACWHQAEFEVGDPVNSPVVPEIEARIEDEYESCLDTF